MIAPRGEAHAFGGFGEEAAARIVRRGDAVEQFALDMGVEKHGPRAGKLVEAGLLNVARGGDADGDFRRPFGGRRQGKIGMGDGRHLDMDVDAVEHRP